MIPANGLGGDCALSRRGQPVEAVAVVGMEEKKDGSGN